MSHTFRKQKRRSQQQEDEWGGSKPKNNKGHKSERARVRKALRVGDDPTELE